MSLFKKSFYQDKLASLVSSLSLSPSPQPVVAATAAPPSQSPPSFSLHLESSSRSSSAPNHSRRIPVGTFWANRISAHIRYHTKREENELSARQIRTRDVVFMDPMSDRSSNGDARLAKLQWWLNNLGVLRSPDQALFHKHFTNACLPKIFGEKDWNERSMSVMDELGIKEIRFEVTAITPRVKTQTHVQMGLRVGAIVWTITQTHTRSSCFRCCSMVEMGQNLVCGHVRSLPHAQRAGHSNLRVLDRQARIDQFNGNHPAVYG